MVAPFPDRAATADRHRRRAPTDPADRLHGQGGTARRPGRCDGGQDCTLLVVRPTPTMASALRGTADTLLNAASYGSRWVLLSPAPAGGECGPGPSTPGPRP